MTSLYDKRRVSMRHEDNHGKNRRLGSKMKFGTYMVIFSSSLSVAFFLHNKVELPIFWKGLIGLLPAIPFSLAMIELARFIRNDDEMFKKIISDAILVTFMITLVCCIALGTLQMLSVLPVFSVFYLFIAMSLLFSFSYARVASTYQ